MKGRKRMYPNRPAIERVIRFSAALLFSAAFVAGAVFWKGAASSHAAQAEPGHLKIVFTSTQHASCPPDPVCEGDGEFGELYVMNRNGSDQRRITFDTDNELAAVWSPDGTTIAYHSLFDGHPQIFLTNPNGLGKFQVTDTPFGAQFPDWSPDGKSIVFQTPAVRITKEDGHVYTVRDIFVINADGTGLVNLTKNLDPMSPNHNQDVRPAWSPDGQKIAFQSNRDGNNEIYVMDAQGSILRRLTLDLKSDEAPDWSPDGSKIVFQKKDDPGLYSPSQIWVMNADGADPMALTNTGSPLRNLDPAWSPDGKKIAFDSDRDNTQQIRQVWVMDADGMNQKSLTSLPGESGHAGWGWAADADEDASIAQPGHLILGRDPQSVSPIGVMGNAVSEVSSHIRDLFALTIGARPMHAHQNTRLWK